MVKNTEIKMMKSKHEVCDILMPSLFNVSLNSTAFLIPLEHIILHIFKISSLCTASPPKKSDFFLREAGGCTQTN